MMFGRVTSISGPGVSNSFTYNGLDTRVGKVDSAGTSTYRRDGADVTAPVLGDGAAVYTPGVSQRRGGATVYDLHDQLGTATKQTGSSATVTATRTYDAFGMLVSSSGTPQGPFGFAATSGYQEDGDSGLKLLGHRYYDPSTGRFLTRDPAQDGRNWYAYCENNPIRFVDSDGKQKHKVPKAPPGVSARKNAQEAIGLAEQGVAFPIIGIGTGSYQLYKNVRNGGKWDYKQKGRQYEDFGNFNYGVVMAAYGVPEDIALRGAGWAQTRSGNYDPKNNSPMGSPPYGDDPHDQEWIKEGYWYYNHVIDKK